MEGIEVKNNNQYYNEKNYCSIDDTKPFYFEEEKNYCSIDDTQYYNSQSSKEEQSIFINEKKIVDTMRISAKKGSEKIAKKISEITKIFSFSESSSNNGNIKADLNIGIVDKNGFLDYGNQDLNITLNGNIKIKKDVFFKPLEDVVKKNKVVERSFWYDVDLGRVWFDSKTRSYKIQILADILGPVNDEFYLVVKPDKNNNLVMSIEDKDIPDWIKSDKEILKKVEEKIMAGLNNNPKFGLSVQIRGDKLYFLPKIKNQEFKINEKESFRIDKNNIDYSNTKFNIDNEGDIEINLKNVSVTASNIGKDEKGKNISEKSSNDIDFVDVSVSIDINTKGDKEVVIKNGRVSTNLDSKESERIKIENSTFNKHFSESNIEIKGLTGKLIIDKDNKTSVSIGGDVSINLKKEGTNIGIDGKIATKLNSKGDFQVASNDIKITHNNGISYINELLVSDDKDGLTFHINEQGSNLPPLNVKTTKNFLDIIIGADNYKKKLFDSISKAKESINVESYLYSGKIGEELADLLIFKASGLSDNKGKISLSNKEGVKVKVIFDSALGDQTEQTHESIIMIRNKYNKFIKDVKEGNGKFSTLTEKERKIVINNVEKNMKYKLLKGGITKIDHRKLVIIDGKMAMAGGGINLTDSAMNKHDMMTEVFGPAVNQIQTEFLQNWEEVAGKLSEDEKKMLIKDDNTLKKAMKIYQKETGKIKTSNTQVLVTDDNQFQTYQKIIEQIRNAKFEINIEHAYFTNKEIIEEVSNAIKRGVNVNVILPEESDEGDRIHYGNLGTLQKLKKASLEPNAGKFNAYLFRKDVKFNHTKAMSFDGKTAIVGSTNLTNRSLKGTITGFLFNKEMSLFIDDKDFVKKLNKDLFFSDMKPERAIKLDDKWFENLKIQQEKIDKYSELQPLF